MKEKFSAIHVLQHEAKALARLERVFKRLEQKQDISIGSLREGSENFLSSWGHGFQAAGQNLRLF